MTFFQKLTVKQQFVQALVVLILLSSVLTGLLAYNQSRQLVVSRMLQHEMPSLVRQVSLTLESQIAQMTTATQQLAENPYILRWAEAGFAADDETVLLTQIKKVKQAGIDAIAIASALKNTRVEPVLTAHPTEAKRATVLEHHRELYLLLVERENTMFSSQELMTNKEKIKSSLYRLWKTGTIQSDYIY